MKTTLYIFEENKTFEVVTSLTTAIECREYSRVRGSLNTRYYDLVGAVEQLKKMYLPNTVIFERKT